MHVKMSAIYFNLDQSKMQNTVLSRDGILVHGIFSFVSFPTKLFTPLPKTLNKKNFENICCISSFSHSVFKDRNHHLNDLFFSSANAFNLMKSNFLSLGRVKSFIWIITMHKF